MWFADTWGWVFEFPNGFLYRPRCDSSVQSLDNPLHGKLNHLRREQAVAAVCVQGPSLGLEIGRHCDRSSVMARIADNHVAEHSSRKGISKRSEHAQVSVIRQHKEVLDTASIPHSSFQVHEVVANTDSDSTVLFRIEHIYLVVANKRPRWTKTLELPRFAWSRIRFSEDDPRAAPGRLLFPKPAGDEHDSFVPGLPRSSLQPVVHTDKRNDVESADHPFKIRQSRSR